MTRVFNFSPGPGALPESVLHKASAEMLDYHNKGISVMEMSHRSEAFKEIIETADGLFRKLMNIPDNYHILFLQGGASTQFAMVPLNLFGKNNKADFIDSGRWSQKAISETERYGLARIAASSKDANYNYIPEMPKFDPEAAFVHITTNNTIYGTRIKDIPDTGNVPLVADMSSNILSEPIDVSKFGIIYAGAQKNLGPAGVTVVIIRDDLVGDPLEMTPTMLRYGTHVKSKSLYNTPPVYSIYMVKLVLEWIESMGGLNAVAEMNREKADLLYNYIDDSKLFKGTARKEDRSLMNVPFLIPDDELNKQFITEADKNGLIRLKGHRSVGGMRASIYNAMPREGVEKLVEFMKKFEKENKGAAHV